CHRSSTGSALCARRPGRRRRPRSPKPREAGRVRSSQPRPRPKSPPCGPSEHQPCSPPSASSQGAVMQPPRESALPVQHPALTPQVVPAMTRTQNTTFAHTSHRLGEFLRNSRLARVFATPDLGPRFCGRVHPTTKPSTTALPNLHAPGSARHGLPHTPGNTFEQVDHCRCTHLYELGLQLPRLPGHHVGAGQTQRHIPGRVSQQQGTYLLSQHTLSKTRIGGPHPKNLVETLLSGTDPATVHRGRTGVLHCAHLHHGCVSGSSN